MENKLMRTDGGALLLKEIGEIEKCNGLTEKFGLALSKEQIRNLMEKRREALKNTGRVEFGGGILKKLITEFCDSPYIDQESYEETLLELQDIFYYFKNESLDSIADDDLLRLMKKSFDGQCEGSLEYLRETSLEEMCRAFRFRL
jgi:hypothetical protein